MTIGGPNRLLHKIYSADAAATLLRSIPLIVLLIGSAAAFAQERSAAAPESGNSSVSGQVKAITGQGQTEVVTGIELRLSGAQPDSTSSSAVTDDDGRFQFLQLPPGVYRLEASPEGFQPWTAIIALGDGQTAVKDVLLHIKSSVQGLEVHGDASEISTENAETTAALNDELLNALPLAQQKFTEALSLDPGVIRTNEGKLNFSGQTESEGLLLLNSTENVDPVTGSFSISVPIDVIQSMVVHDAPDTAEYGGFSGGLTQIETKPPSDSWNYRVHDFIPGFRGKNGVLRGIADFTPRVVFGGPLIKGKLNFTQELTWEVRNQPVRGLALAIQ